jgi:hypothetical protein
MALFGKFSMLLYLDVHLLCDQVHESCRGYVKENLLTLSNGALQAFRSLFRVQAITSDIQSNLLNFIIWNYMILYLSLSLSFFVGCFV